MLADIDDPADLRRLDIEELPALCTEIREAIRAYVAERGGHLGANLGVVELTVALHYALDTPRDQLVFDVSHQCYAHKMLTGRQAAFVDPAHLGEASGFTNPVESAYDLFAVGHASTAVSLACGLAQARDLAGRDHAVVAVVGDGALSGGEALEGLSNAAALGSGIVIVVNDNNRSIAENVGGLYDGLAELRATGGAAQHNLFRDLGLAYSYVGEGNDVRALVSAVASARESRVPTVLHVRTRKGLGDPWAEAHPEAAHELPVPDAGTSGEAWAHARVAEGVVRLAEEDPRVVVVCPATPLSCGLTPELRGRLGRRYVDVGIAEAHALTFAAGLARGGARPVVCISSTFLQRAYDQLVEDVALGALPVALLVYKAGLDCRDATHVGSLDLVMEGSIPGLASLVPGGVDECLAMLGWAVHDAAGPVAIRVPRSGAGNGRPGFSAGGVGSWEVLAEGSRAALVSVGRVGDEVLGAARLLSGRLGAPVTVVRATSAAPLDETLLSRLARDHDVVAIVEDGVAAGGVGSRVAALLGDSPARVLVRGGGRAFTQRVPLAEQHERWRMTAGLLADDVIASLASSCPLPPRSGGA